MLAGAKPDSSLLYQDLIMSYNHSMHQVQNHSGILLVKLSLKLSQLILVPRHIQTLVTSRASLNQSTNLNILHTCTNA